MDIYIYIHICIKIFTYIHINTYVCKLYTHISIQVCLCICIDVYSLICIYVYLYMYIFICVFLHMYVHIYVYIYDIHMYTYIYSYVQAQTNAHVHTQILTYENSWSFAEGVSIDINVYIYTYIYIHIHICTTTHTRIQNPTDEEPWAFSVGKHWDSLSPEDKGFMHGEDWTTAGGNKLLKGTMKNGDNKKWSDVDDQQWGFAHQFADWDPNGDKNMRLMWGDGGLARSGGETPNDSRLEDATNIYEEPTMKKGNKPWELSFMDPRLEGDDFVGKGDYLKSMHPEFQNPVDNQFADLDEEVCPSFAACLHARMRACVHTRKHIHTRVFLCAHTHSQHVCMHTRERVRMCVHTLLYTITHTHMHAHMYVSEQQQLSATRCNTLQHTVTYCNTLEHRVKVTKMLSLVTVQHAATCCNTL